MNGSSNIASYAYIFLFFSVNIFSQSQISGKVTASGNTLQGASVILKNTDNKIIGYSITDQNGFYLKKIPVGSYTIEVNYLGLKKEIISLTITDSQNIVKDFVLKESGEMLETVVIKNEKPVSSRGDTLIFDAKALSTGSETVVEELLKNIPGITIEKNGKILYNNTLIEKIMVEGDDLFNQGYSILTRNMPSKPLNKIEVLKNYSNNKLLKGIEDSEKVAINLTLDEGYKNLWFGNIKVGLGNNNRYSANGNLMNFTKAYKSFFTSDFNNAGYDKIGAIDEMIYNSVDLETIGLGYHCEKVMGLGLNSTSLGQDRSNFNNTKMATLSTIFPLGTKAKLKLVGFLGFDKLSAFNELTSFANTENISFENNEINNAVDNIKKSYFNILLNYDISKRQLLQASSTFNSGISNFSNNYTFNANSTQELLETRNTFFDQKITYTHKFDDLNVVLFKTRIFTDKLPQNYAIDDYLLGNLFSDANINSIGSDNKNSKQYAGIEADFKLKQKSGDFINFAVGIDNNSDKLISSFRLFTNNGLISPADFQSDITYRSKDLYARSGYVFKFNKFLIGGSANLHQLFNTYTDNKGGYKTQEPFFVNPNINASWDIKPDNKIIATYNYNFTNSSLLQVNDNYILASSRSFSKGIGYFNQWENAKATLNFKRQHYLNRYAYSFGAEYSKQNDVLIYSTQLNQNSSLSDALVIRGGDKFGLRFSSHYIFRKLLGTAKFDANNSRLVYFNEINGSGLRKNILYNQSYIFRWNSNFKSDFNFSLGSEWNFSKIQSDNAFNNASNYNYLNLKYVINNHFNINLKMEHYNFKGIQQQSDYLFSDLEAFYSFRKEKYTIGLDGRNLFNTNRFTMYNVSDIGFSTNSYDLLPRYIILSFKLRFE